MSEGEKPNLPRDRQKLTAKVLLNAIAGLLGLAALCVGVACIVLVPAGLLGRWVAPMYHLGWAASTIWIVALWWQVIAWMTITEETTLKYFDLKTGTFQPKMPTRLRSPRRRLILIVTTMLVVLGAIAEKYLP